MKSPTQTQKKLYIENSGPPLTSQSDAGVDLLKKGEFSG